MDQVEKGHHVEKGIQVEKDQQNNKWADIEDDDLFDNEEIYLYYLHKWADQNPDYHFSFIVPKGIPKKNSSKIIKNLSKETQSNNSKFVPITGNKFSNRFKK